MVCRLAPEKSVGLFLQAASELVHTFQCTTCRFIIAGDGKLSPHLQHLASRLRLDDYVQFTGWLTKEHVAAAAVSSWDVAVTTGAWRETFSIAGLELLALGVPLVTFATGGMGEYIADPASSFSSSDVSDVFNCSERVAAFLSSMNTSILSFEEAVLRATDQQVPPMNNTTPLCPFAVADNAVVVLRAHPRALALAMLYLDRHPDDRSRVGFAGITTATRHFHTNKTRDLYVEFLLGIMR
jgi:glycosyltransferase involved in cell wall biosynthesis